MDSQIIAAIIGAAGAAITGIITYWLYQRHRRFNMENYEKSRALKLGYIIAAIESYLDGRKLGITSPAVDAALSIQTKRAQEIANRIGLSVEANPERIVKDMELKIDGKPINIKSAYIIGHIIGRCYFYGISLIATGSLPLNMVDNNDIDKMLKKAENLLQQAELPFDFLSPVKKLWRETFTAAREGKTVSISSQMEEILDNLCSSIERRR